MARRIIYNPADLVEAQTPFFDNIVGAIADQTDRIARNIERVRQKEAILEERTFQSNLMTQRIEAREAEGRRNRRFQGTQAAIEQDIAGEQHEDMMEYRWASLQQEQTSAWHSMIEKSQKERAQEMKEKTKLIQDKVKGLANAGLYDPDGAPAESWKAAFDDATNQWVVREGKNGRVIPMDNFLDNSKFGFLEDVKNWMGTKAPAFLDKLHDAKDNFAITGVEGEDGEMVKRDGGDMLVTGDGRIGVGRDYLGNALYDLRDGLVPVYDENGEFTEQAKVIQGLMTNEGKYFLLEKDSEQAKQWDTQQVNSVVGDSKRWLTDFNTYRNWLVDTTGKPLTPFTTENIEEVFPNITDIALPYDPDVTLERKSLGRAYQAIKNQEMIAFDQDKEPQKLNTDFDKQRPTLNNMIDQAKQVAIDYKDQLDIPEQFRGKDPTWLGLTAKVNKEEWDKDNPDPTKMYTWADYSDEEINEMKDKSTFNLFDDEARMFITEQQQLDRAARISKGMWRGY